MAAQIPITPARVFRRLAIEIDRALGPAAGALEPLLKEAEAKLDNPQQLEAALDEIEDILEALLAA